MHQINEFSSKDEVLVAVAKDGWALEHAGAKLKDDEEVVLAAVKKHGDALQFASKALKANEKVALAAVKKNSSALLYVAPVLTANSAFFLAAVAENDEALPYACEALRNDPSFFWQIWNIQKSEKDDKYRKAYITDFLFQETFNILLGAGSIALSAGLLLSGVIALPVPVLAVLTVGVISLTYTVYKVFIHGYSIFKAQSERATPSVENALAR